MTSRIERKKALAQHERAQAKIDKLMKRWVGDLWLGQWDIRAVYEWNGIKNPRGASDHPLAECDADWKYMQASIRFDLPQCSVVSDETLQEVVVHELMHCVVHEMRTEGIAHEERVVSHLQRIACFLARKGSNQP